MQFDVFGIENPLIDLLAQVPDEFLDGVGLEKNKMYLVDSERHQALLSALRDIAVRAEPGGSCANTLLGIAQLGGKAAYCGKVGADDHGRVYIQKLEAGGVTSYINAQGSLTGSTVILITPDASRTMNTFLGACQELGPADVPLDALGASREVYLTGYLWDTPNQQEAALAALNEARKRGIPVVMSLADPFCVERHKEDFERILKDYVGLVFANRDEALAVTGTDNTQQALRVLRNWCPGAAITLGAAGALVCQDDETVYIDPFAAEPVDTTGAGDAFAAGFLHGRINGASLLQCGRLGSYFAAQVIQKVGPRLEGDLKKALAPVLDDPRG
ncbi:MAG: adenosine kinase [bacterium]